MLRRVGTLALAMLAAGGIGIPTASAVPPGASNDRLSGAKAITALPYDDSVDVSRATTDQDDDDLNAQCGAPATLGSIWYTFTAPAGVDVLIVDVSQSTYTSGVIVAESDGAGGWYVDTCGPGTVGFPVQAGVTYTILAFNDTPGSTGGRIVLHAEAAAIPTIDVTVNKTGKVDRDGRAIISGTYTCTDGDFVELYTTLTQSVGRFTISGDGFASGEPCDGRTHSWTAIVTAYNGTFGGGRSAAATDGFTCGAFFCADSFVQQTVKLSR
jgi:hypothetical protein